MTSFDYRTNYVRLCDKLLRQRIYYIATAKGLEYDMPDMSHTEADDARCRIESLLGAANDLKFIVDRAMRGLPVDDVEEIQNLSQTRGGKAA